MVVAARRNACLRLVLFAAVASNACGGDDGVSSSIDGGLDASAPSHDASTMFDATSTSEGGPQDAGVDATQQPDALTTDATNADAIVTDAPVTTDAMNDATMTDAAIADDAMTDDAMTDVTIVDAVSIDAPIDAIADAGGVLSPSNLPPSICDTPGASDFDVTSDGGITTIDTTNMAACSFIVSQTGGAPDICVVKYRDVAIAAGGSIRAQGPRALALVATSTMTIDGVVEGGSFWEDGTIGPGGGAFAAGAGGSTNPQSGAAGGGAGFGTIGGAGGNSYNGTSGALGGAAYGSPTLVPLLGGASGGSGSTLAGDTETGYGGAGGGAIELVSCGTLVVGASAHINAGGAGGFPGLGFGGAGGGGSGGGILIEAASITVQGHIVANGGGGGGPGLVITCNTPDYGYAGDDATNEMPAQGGSNPFGAGGAGGAASAAPVAGSAGAKALDCYGAGGGGGAVGVIRLNVPLGMTPATTGAIFSPMPTSGTVATH
jgi:hypothetical protein